MRGGAVLGVATDCCGLRRRICAHERGRVEHGTATSASCVRVCVRVCVYGVCVCVCVRVCVCTCVCLHSCVHV
jgi:hypothetical protein